MLRMAWLPAGSAVQLGLLVLAGRSPEATSSGSLLAASTLLTLLLLQQIFRRKRAMLDTPTSRIGSAAQGYVEITGQAVRAQTTPLRSKLTGLPCVWFRYSVERKRGDRWELVDSGVSGHRLRLQDESGDCTVDPHGADIIPRRRDRWRKGDYRFTEELLLEGEQLYALGELRAEGGAGQAPAHTSLLSALLTRWKKDQPALLARFDLDGSGHLDDREWTLVRSAAHREATTQGNVLRASQSRPVMGACTLGRPFILSNFPPEQLAQRWVWWFRVQAGVLIVHGIAWTFWLRGIGVT